MKEVGQLLSAADFRFKKRFGQNFVTDTNFLRAMADDAEIGAADTVLEVGAGAGTLTRVLAERAAEVFACEIDETLRPILAETLGGLDDQVTLFFGDFLKIGEEIVGRLPEGYKVVANLPYYITTPLLMRFLEAEKAPASVTVMTQKEVGERLVAHAGDAAYGAVSVAVALAGTAELTRTVPKELFTPRPKVDSCVVRIRTEARYGAAEKAEIRKLVKAAFSMRRKTLVNNLAGVYPKDAVAAALEAMGLDPRVRGEMLEASQYARLAALLSRLK